MLRVKPHPRALWIPLDLLCSIGTQASSLLTCTAATESLGELHGFGVGALLDSKSE